MERRDFITKAGGVVATALMGSCATLNGPPLEAFGAEDIHGFLAGVRARVRRTRAPKPATDPIRMFVERRGFRTGLLEESAAAMLVASTFRDLSPKLQRHPEVQDWVVSEAPRMARATYEMTDFLAGLDTRERRKVGSALRNDPTLGRDLVDRFELDALGGMHSKRAKQGRDLLDHVNHRLTKQGPSAMIEEYIDKAARVSKRHGFDWRDYDELLAEAAADPPTAERRKRRMHPVIKAALIVLGIGAGIAIAGQLILLVGVAVASVGLVFGGFLLLVAGIFIAAVSGVLAIIGNILNQPESSRDYRDLPPQVEPEPEPEPGPKPDFEP